MGKSAPTGFFFEELCCKLPKVHVFFPQLHSSNPSQQCGALASAVLWPPVIHLGQAFLTEQTLGTEAEHFLLCHRPHCSISGLASPSSLQNSQDTQLSLAVSPQYIFLCSSVTGHEVGGKNFTVLRFQHFSPW